MKKIGLIFNCIILMLICQPMLSCSALSEAKTEAIVGHCDTIKTSLKKVQRDDSRIRVFLGSHYDALLTKFITPLNVRLVENNLSNAELIDNQNEIAETKTVFSNDFTKYQQMLEELILVDCKNEPEKFYDNLVGVRQKRKTMEQDVLKMRRLFSEHIKLVGQLRGKL